jgi:hypothetical protein
MTSSRFPLEVRGRSLLAGIVVGAIGAGLRNMPRNIGQAGPESESSSCAVGVSSFSPAALSQAPQEAANSAFGILECSNEAVERTGAVLDAVEPPIPSVAGRIAACLVDRADTDLARVDLEMFGAVVGFVVELEHQCLYRHAPTGRNAAQSFCYDGFGHDALLTGCVVASPGPELRNLRVGRLRRPARTSLLP